MKCQLPRIERLRVLLNTECNLKCLYCHKEGQYSLRERIKFDELKGLLRILMEYGVDEVKFSGGEPLLHPRISELIDYTKNELRADKVSVTTNGVLLRDKVKRFEAMGLDELSISIDTLNYDTFEKLNCGDKTLLDNAFAGISEASESNIPKVNLNVTLTSLNINEVPRLIDYSKKLNLPIRLISFIDVGKKTSYLQTSLKDLIINLESSAEYRTGEPLKDNKAYTDYLIKGHKVTFVNGVCPDCEECGRSYALRLTTDGKLKPCLISEKGEIDILTPYRKGDMKEVHHNIEKAVALKKYGLIVFADIPERFNVNKYFLPPEDPK